MNNKPCGLCEGFFALEKGLQDGRRKELKHGYCLKRSIFANNKVGNPILPPRAKTAELPQAMHKLKIVRVNEIVPTCNEFNRKEDKRG
jgi:hypothetical protein